MCNLGIKGFFSGVKNAALWGAGCVAAAAAATATKTNGLAYGALELMGIYSAQQAVTGLVAMPFVIACPKKMNSIGMGRAKALNALVTGIKGICITHSALALTGISPTTAAAKIIGGIGANMAWSSVFMSDGRMLFFAPELAEKVDKFLKLSGVAMIGYATLLTTLSYVSLAVSVPLGALCLYGQISEYTKAKKPSLQG